MHRPDGEAPSGTLVAPARRVLEWTREQVCNLNRSRVLLIARLASQSGARRRGIPAAAVSHQSGPLVSRD
jgi:hypothetical protein